MSNDAETRKVHATVTDPEDPNEPVTGDQAERPEVFDEDGDLAEEDDDLAAEDDVTDDGDLAEPDAVVVEEVVVAEAEPAGDVTDGEPVTAGSATSGPPGAGGTPPGTGPAEAVQAEPVPVDTAGGASVAGTGAVPEAAGPGMPVNADVPADTQLGSDPEQLHERWTAIQATFVDDPRGSVTSAADLLTEVISTFVTSVQERETGLRGEWDRDDVDTEGLRNALRGYRALLDQLTTQ